MIVYLNEAVFQLLKITPKVLFVPSKQFFNGRSYYMCNEISSFNSLQVLRFPKLNIASFSSCCKNKPTKNKS